MSISKTACVMMTGSLLGVLLCGDATPVYAQSPPSMLGATLLAAATSEVSKAVESGTAVSSPEEAQPVRGSAEPAGAMPRPRVSGSATGYVENAFIGSQVRVRFDAGFGIGSPDRSEFFYAKCGCFRLLGIDPDAAGPVGSLTGGDPLLTPLIEHDLDYRELQVYGEFAPHPRFSVSADVPLRSLSPSVIPSETGLGDIRAGVKVGLVASDLRALTFQFRSYFPSGDSRKGLGTDHASLEFSLLYAENVAERVSVGGELGVWHPIDPSSGVPASSNADWADNIVRWGLSFGVDLVGRPDLSVAPVVEVVGWHLTGGYATFSPDGTPAAAQTLAAGGTDIVNLKVGGRVTFNGRNSIYVGYGRALTDAHWYDDIVRAEYRFAF